MNKSKVKAEEESSGDAELVKVENASFSRMVNDFAFQSPERKHRSKKEEDDTKPSLSRLRTKVKAETPATIVKCEIIDLDVYLLSIAPPEVINVDDLGSPSMLPRDTNSRTPSPSPSTPTAKRKLRARIDRDFESGEYQYDSRSPSPGPSFVRGWKKTPPNGNGKPRSRKKARVHAEPDKYAHLNIVPDRLGRNLDVLFCGINPGVESARSGHHFAYKGNNFYRMLFGAGFTDRVILASEDITMPIRYNVGIVNLVDRPTSCEAELSQKEMFERVPELLEKLTEYKPRFVCFIGKGMCANVEKILKREVTKSRQLSATSQDRLRKLKTEIGLRPFKLEHHGDGSKLSAKETLFYCSHSSSGLATSATLAEKIANLKTLRNLLSEYREDKLDTSTFWTLR